MTKSTLRIVASTTPLVIGGRACGLLVWGLIARRFGLNEFLAPLLYTWAVVVVLNMIVSSAVEHAFVPLYLQAKHDEKRLQQTIAVLQKLLVGFSAIFILAALAVPLIIPLVSGFDSQSISAIRLLLWAFIPALIFQALGCAARARANAERQYRMAARSVFIEGSLQLLSTALLLPALGVYAVPAGAAVGGVGAFLSTPQRTFVFTGNWNFHRPASVGVWGFITAQVLGTIIVSVNPVIDQLFASFLGGDAVSLISYGSRVFLVPVGLLLSGMLPVFLSELSRREAAGENEEFCQYASRSLWVTAGAAVGVAVVAGAFADPLIRLVLLQTRIEGNFTHLKEVCQILFLGTLPYVLMNMLARIHLARMDQAVIWIGAIGNTLLNCVLNALFVRPWGVNGIALATVLDYSLVTLFLLGMFLRQKRKLPCRKPQFASSCLL